MVNNRFEQSETEGQKTMAGDKATGSPTLHSRKTWGLPGLWSGAKGPLPKLSECDDENTENISGHFHLEDSFYSDNTSEPIYFLSVKQGSHDNNSVVIVSGSTPRHTQEAPELTTPTSELSGMVPHGPMHGPMRRNIQSFDEGILLGSVSEMPIPEDYMKQQRGFVSSLYGSLSELNIGKKPMSSQPSSAESSRCSSPTGFITERVKESGITGSPAKMHGRFGRLFRDLNATAPTNW